MTHQREDMVRFYCFPVSAYPVSGKHKNELLAYERFLLASGLKVWIIVFFDEPLLEPMLCLFPASQDEPSNEDTYPAAGLMLKRCRSRANDGPEDV